MVLKKLDSSEWNGQEEIIAEINITPLTDVFLVLLIIFMVTSSVMLNSGVDVQLPQASKVSSQIQPEGIIVSLLIGGKMKVNQSPIAAGDYMGLKKALIVAFQQTRSRLVILEGDRESFLGSAIHVMDYAREAGAERFAIATTVEPSKSIR